MQVHSEVKVSITTIISVFIECRFGGESYELESTWHPDLGPPFGVMFCVHCECVPVSTTVQQEQRVPKQLFDFGAGAYRGGVVR